MYFLAQKPEFASIFQKGNGVSFGFLAKCLSKGLFGRRPKKGRLTLKFERIWGSKALFSQICQILAQIWPKTQKRALLPKIPNLGFYPNLEFSGESGFLAKNDQKEAQKFYPRLTPKNWQIFGSQKRAKKSGGESLDPNFPKIWPYPLPHPYFWAEGPKAKKFFDDIRPKKA